MERFTLDPLGNWTDFLQDADDATPYDLDQSRSHNKANELIQIDSSSTHVAHDAVGNMTTMPKPTDFAAHYTCTYDAWNRLVKVADGATTVAEYEYDGMHHRTVKKTYVSGTLDETRHYYYDKDWRCLEERVGTNTDAERRYVWGPGARAGDWESENPLGKFFQIAASLPSVSPTRTRHIDEMICRDRIFIDGETTTTERLWAMLDANYNVVGLLEMPDWNVRERYTYDAYGQVEVSDANFNLKTTGTDYDWQHLFTGQRLDLETNLYHYRHRQYHPALGRFVTRDPIGYDGGDANLYRYCWNNPVIYADPIGEKVYWSVRDLDGAFLGNHHFIKIVPDNPKDFPGQLTDLYGGEQGMNLAGFNVGGHIEYKKNKRLMLPDHEKKIDPKRYTKKDNPDYYKSGWDVACHEVKPPNGMTDTQFIQSLLKGANNYKLSTPKCKYAMFGR